MSLIKEEGQLVRHEITISGDLAQPISNKAVQRLIDFAEKFTEKYGVHITISNFYIVNEYKADTYGCDTDFEGL